MITRKGRSPEETPRPSAGGCINTFEIALGAVTITVLIMSGTVHEYAHALAAFRMGDPTASDQGRLTLNPLKHLDPFMSFLLPLITYMTMHFAFGGMKPVPVNPFNLTSKGDMIVSLAGPLSNFALGACVLVLMAVLKPFVPIESLGFAVLWYGVAINFLLGVFNLLPVPPLDGSHVLAYFIPALREPFQRIGMGGMILVIALFYSGIIGFILEPIRFAIDFLIALIYFW